MLATRLDEGFDGVLSFGVAGGLDPARRPGDVVIAEAVMDGDRCLETDPRWTRALRHALPVGTTARITGSDTAITTVEAKQALYRTHGAVAVDMESHIAARVAHARRLPFAACRVVLDDAAHEVPAVAVAGMADDGRSDILAVLAALARSPGQLGALLHLARDAAAARAALRNARRALGDSFALPAPPASDEKKPGDDAPGFPSHTASAARATAATTAAATTTAATTTAATTTPATTPAATTTAATTPAAAAGHKR